MNPTPSKTPASLIEDGYAIDLVPWWKYLWQRFNPWRLWPKEETKWIPVTPEFFKGEWGCERVAGLYLMRGGMPVVRVFDSTGHDLALLSLMTNITHYCPLPPLP